MNTNVFKTKAILHLLFSLVTPIVLHCPTR